MELAGILDSLSIDRVFLAFSIVGDLVTRRFVNRSTPGGSPATKLPPRIVLQADKDRWHYRPLELPNAKLASFPRLPISIVYRCSAWLSQVWQHYGRVGCVLLYWDAQHQRWEAEVPPQMINQHAYVCDLSFKGFQAPSRDHLLCGSFSSDSTDDGEDVMNSVPPFDGIHIVQHVQHELIAVSAFFRAGDQPLYSQPQNWLEQMVDPVWERWMQRVRLAGSF